MWNFEFYDVEEDAKVRSYAEILSGKQDEEGLKTLTTLKQVEIEKNVLKAYRCNKNLTLTRHKHVAFLKNSLIHLDESYECLDSSRPWLCYWILHSLQILGETLEAEEYSKIAGFLGKCQSEKGGFGGGPGQLPHIATTYAAVNALCIIGTPEAYAVINREGLYNFLLSLRGEDGSFSVHVDGEVDTRGAYCAISVARLTNIFTSELFKGTEDWIAKCQTWEGGFGGCPGMEAHGGYSFCGLAALILLGKTNVCHMPSFLRWIVNRQMRLEGGFQGRTNKLVDACYSFWQGGAFPLIQVILMNEGKIFNSKHWLFHQEALQEYILLCCQHASGGLIDKLEKNSDIYHTCYALSGLSIAQHSPRLTIIGPPSINSVEMIHPVYNVSFSAAENALNYFNTLPKPG